MHQYPEIEDEKVFQYFISDLFYSNFNSALFSNFGIIGTKQKGIDIISSELLIDIKCKKKE